MANRGYATLIGVGKFRSEDMAPLPCCLRDAIALHAVLTHPRHGAFPPEQVFLLSTGSDEEIRAAATAVARERGVPPPAEGWDGASLVQRRLEADHTNILNKVHHAAHYAGEEDLVLVWIACHAVIRSDQLYLLPTDASLNVLSDAAIPFSTLKGYLARSRARQKVLILDVCYSGAAAETPPAEHEKLGKLLAHDDGVAVLASSRPWEVSYEDDALGHGVFTHALIQALAGAADTGRRGYVTLADVSAYVERRVKSWVNRRVPNRLLQLPTLYTARKRADQIVMSGTRPSPAARPAAYERSGAMENPFVEKFAKRLIQCETLTKRCEDNRQLKCAIAEFFLDRYLGLMTQAGVRRYFFESGSSIAYLSEAFAGRFNREWLRRSQPDLWIETNNIMTYLEFSLFHPVQVDLYPHGPPEEKYGATFGPLNRVPELAPPEGNQPIEGQVLSVVRQISGHIAANYRQDGVVFMACSALDMSDNVAGPHVGSYYNMLFKRALLEAGCPTVLFLDEKKVPREFDRLRCYSLFGQDGGWSKVCKTSRLALAIAFENKDRRDGVKESLEKLGFNHFEEGPDDGILTLIASNRNFHELRKRWFQGARDESSRVAARPVSRVRNRPRR